MPGQHVVLICWERSVTLAALAGFPRELANFPACDGPDGVASVLGHQAQVGACRGTVAGCLIGGANGPRLYAPSWTSRCIHI